MSSNLDMFPPFVGPMLRIDRAKLHFNTLQEEVAEFNRGEAYTVVSEKNGETGEVIVRIKVSQEVPSHWAILIGDIFHSLRSALDNLAIDLLRMHSTLSKTAIDETYFPVGKTKADFEIALSKKLRRVHPDAIEMVKGLKPYKGGADAFWTIHRLNILDKHVCLLPSVVVRSECVYSADRFIDVEGDTLAAFLNGLKEGVRANYGVTSGLKDGDVVATIPDIHFYSERPGGGMDKALPVDGKVCLTLDVAFGKGQVIDGKPIIPAIDELISFTENVIKVFMDRFS